MNLPALEDRADIFRFSPMNQTLRVLGGGKLGGARWPPGPPPGLTHQVLDGGAASAYLAPSNDCFAFCCHSVP